MTAVIRCRVSPTLVSAQTRDSRLTIRTTGGTFNSVLLPYDLTRGGSLYNYYGHTDVKELALYVQDQITLKNWLFNVGIRGDLYNGLAISRQAEPRVGVAYTISQDQHCSAAFLRTNPGNAIQ